MPLAVKGLLISLLSLINVLEWLTSPQGWITTTYVAVYLAMTASGIYDTATAITFAGVLSVLSCVFLFEPDDYQN